MKNFLPIVLSLIFMAAIPAPDTTPKYFERSQQEGLNFLRQLDFEAYEAAWDDTSPIFQELYPRKAWLHRMQTVRGPLGHAVQRKVLEQLEVDNPAYFPDGTYIMIVFQTKFEDGLIVDELVTQIRDGLDWKTVMYYFQISPLNN